MDFKPKVVVAPKVALAKLTKICSMSEKCSRDVRALLKRWGVESLKQDEILNYLIQNNYLDDQRFAQAYIRDKENFSNWGVDKIKMGLRSKGIDPLVIGEFIGMINDDDMEKKIIAQLERKQQGLKYKDRYDLRNKLLRFAYTRGYSMKVVQRYLQQAEINEEE